MVSATSSYILIHTLSLTSVVTEKVRLEEVLGGDWREEIRNSRFWREVGTREFYLLPSPLLSCTEREGQTV